MGVKSNRCDLLDSGEERQASDRLRYGPSFHLPSSCENPMIELSTVFKENLAQMPSIDGIERIDLVNAASDVVATIENKPGKQGSLAVYNYLQQAFGALNAKAAQHGLDVFAEHTIDARNRPGAHPNVDRLLEVVAGGEALNIRVIPAA
jgi:hypothetical protein